jgi:hypothetical protein
MTPSSNDAARSLQDRIDVERLAILYGKGNDRGGRYFDQCLCDDVQVEYSFGKWTGREEHKRVHAATIPVIFTFTQHLITNADIEIHGDTATGEYLVTAAHGVNTKDGPRVIWAGAIYRQECIRTEKGWRIKRHKCEDLWADDPETLYGAVNNSFGTRG